MNCQWLKLSQSLKQGISILNRLDETKIEQFLRRIVTKLQVQDTSIFTEDEQQKLQKIFRIDEESLHLAIKSVLYLYKRLLKFIFMPNSIKNDLKEIGFTEQKAEAIVRVWSQETKLTLSELNKEINMNDNIGLDVSWKLNAELSSDLCKQTKVPKVYLDLSNSNSKTETELTHNELYSMFMQMESIQNELDNVM